jgi:hypothetical protein
MFSNITTISGISSKLGNFARSGRSRTVLAAAVAATGLAMGSISNAALSNITVTSLVTSTSSVTAPSTASNILGAGSQYSPFQAPNTFNVTYQGNDEKVVALTAGGKTYNATGFATATVERNASNSNNNDTLWYAGTYSGKNINVQAVNYGTAPSPDDAALNTNNVLLGADNIFSNTGNAVGNNTNVDRLDILFTGFSASSSKAFAVLERGASNDHDSFGVAAILSENGGVPTSYGPLEEYHDGTWGTSNLNVGYSNEIVLRKNISQTANPLQPSDSTGQSVGGVLIPTTDLGVATGTTIYGYSLFSAAVSPTSTSAQLVAYQNLASANSTSTGGGLDPLATVGVLYTSAVPEPTSIGLLTLAAGGLMARRPKRKLA